MFAKRWIAQFPQVFIPNVKVCQVVRVIAKHGRKSVKDRQPVLLVACKQCFLGVCKVFLRCMPERKDLAHVAALCLHAAQLSRIADCHRALMDFPADGVAVWIVAGCSQHDPCRLPPGRAGRAGHNVPQLAVRLGMKLVENHAARLVAMLAVCLGR